MSNPGHSLDPICRIRMNVVAGVIALFLAFVPVAMAQKSTKPERKVLVSVKPDYSELLRHAQIGGLVRLRATVAADGRVTHVEIIGGNPILAESASAAVMKWKYVAAADQTVEEVSINFAPH